MAVEDGRPFCPQCRAPQIHVQVAIPDAEIAVGLNPAPDVLAPEIPQSGYFGRPNVTSGMMTAGSTMDSRVAVRAALKAGVLGFFLGMLVPFVAIVLAGALAVFFYRRESGFVLPAALASRIGGAAGVVAVAVQSFFFALWIFVLHRQKEYIDSVTRFVHSVGGDASIPDIQASIRSLFTPAGLVIGLFFMMIIGVVLASVGGALASVFLRPRNPRV
jgi:hypothetical protein